MKATIDVRDVVCSNVGMEELAKIERAHRVRSFRRGAVWFGGSFAVVALLVFALITVLRVSS